MQAKPRTQGSSPRGRLRPLRTSAQPARRKDLKYAVDEINAYIAIRDTSLAEAEELPTAAKIHRADVANDFVETCLKPSRPPYEAQYLPEADAVRERKRCKAVKVRLAELRAQIA